MINFCDRYTADRKKKPAIKTVLLTGTNATTKSTVDSKLLHKHSTVDRYKLLPHTWRLTGLSCYPIIVQLTGTSCCSNTKFTGTWQVQVATTHTIVDRVKLPPNYSSQRQVAIQAQYRWQEQTATQIQYRWQEQAATTNKSWRDTQLPKYNMADRNKLLPKYWSSLRLARIQTQYRWRDTRTLYQ